MWKSFTDVYRSCYHCLIFRRCVHFLFWWWIIDHSGSFPITWLLPAPPLSWPENKNHIMHFYTGQCLTDWCKRLPTVSRWETQKSRSCDRGTSCDHAHPPLFEVEVHWHSRCKGVPTAGNWTKIHLNVGVNLFVHENNEPLQLSST